MEKIKITGQVYHIGQIEQISDKFKKREFVIKTPEKYPQFINLQVINERCDILDNVRLNDELDVFINIRGREWTDRNGARKFFNTLEAWQLNAVNNATRPDQLTPEPMEPQKQIINNLDPLGFGQNKNDDLPF